MPPKRRYSSDEEIEEELYRAALRCSLIHEYEDEKALSSENSDYESVDELANIDVPLDFSMKSPKKKTKYTFQKKRILKRNTRQARFVCKKPYFKKHAPKDDPTKEDIPKKDVPPKEDVATKDAPMIDDPTKYVPAKDLPTKEEVPKMKVSKPGRFFLIKFLFDDGTFEVVECSRRAVYDDLIHYLKSGPMSNLNWETFVCDLRVVNPRVNLGKLPRNMVLGSLNLPDIVEVKVIVHYW